MGREIIKSTGKSIEEIEEDIAAKEAVTILLAAAKSMEGKICVKHYHGRKRL